MCPHRKEKESENIFKLYFIKLLHILQRSSTQKCSSELFECKISGLADLPERGVKPLYMKLCDNNFSILKYLIVKKSNFSTPTRAKIFLHLAVGDSPGKVFYTCKTPMAVEGWGSVFQQPFQCVNWKVIMHHF